jgi:hypothetical protein
MPDDRAVDLDNNDENSIYPKADIANLSDGSPGSYGLPGQSGDNAYSKGVQLLEIWVRDLKQTETDSGDVSYEDKWRCVMIIGNRIVFDEWAEDLYGINTHPYSRFVFDEQGKFYPPSLIHFMSLPQIAINRLLASMQQNAELTGNPIFIDSAASGIDRSTIINQPGQRLTMTSNSANPPQWLNPPQVPSYMLELVQFWIDRIENISGLSGSVKGMAPAPRTPNSSVQSASETAFVRVRQALRNLGESITKSVSLIAELIIQNYDGSRRIAYFNDLGQGSTLALRDNHFFQPAIDNSDDELPLDFVLRVDMGADSTTSRTAQVSNAITLFGMQAVDQQYLLETLRVPRAMEIIARMRLEQPQQMVSKRRVSRS